MGSLLPHENIRRKVEVAERLANALADVVEELEDDDRFTQWCRDLQKYGGAVLPDAVVDARPNRQGQRRFQPTGLFADDIADYADRLADVLQKVNATFDYRVARQADRRAARTHQQDS